MELREKILYHQIHPLKLVTDFGTAFAAVHLLWLHRLPSALALGFVPSVLVTTILVRRDNLERYKDSALGHYVARYMSPATQMARFVGLAFLWGGAWARKPLAIGFGLGIIVLAWARGVIWPRVSTDEAV